MNSNIAYDSTLDDMNYSVDNQNNFFFGNKSLFYNFNEHFQNDIPLYQINNTIENNPEENSENEISSFSQGKTAEIFTDYYLISKILHKKDESNYEKLPRLYYFNEIKDIIKKVYENNLYEFIINLEINPYIKKAQKEMEQGKRESKVYLDKNNFFELFQNDNEEKRKKRGREPKSTEYIVGSHNKMSPDNVIKKIKAQIFIYSLYFLNNILKESNIGNENKIKKLDYKIVNRIKKELDLKFLDTPLKDLFSMNISSKNIKKSKFNNAFNKNIIKYILNLKADDTINFAFNITLRDWLDLFTFKKNVKDIMDSYDLKNYNYIDSDKIEKAIIGVDALLNKMALKNDNDYLSYFIFYLYNYERWFYIKKGRNQKNSENK